MLKCHFNNAFKGNLTNFLRQKLIAKIIKFKSKITKLLRAFSHKWSNLKEWMKYIYWSLHYTTHAILYYTIATVFYWEPLPIIQHHQQIHNFLLGFQALFSGFWLVNKCTIASGVVQTVGHMQILKICIDHHIPVIVSTQKKSSE